MPFISACLHAAGDSQHTKLEEVYTIMRMFQITAPRDSKSVAQDHTASLLVKLQRHDGKGYEDAEKSYGVYFIFLFHSGGKKSGPQTCGLSVLAGIGPFQKTM